MGFTSNLRDAETGLDFMQARYYSNVQGRFTSPDVPFADQHPDEPQTWNLYAYVTNNPLRYVDSNGRQRLEIEQDRLVREYSNGRISEAEFRQGMGLNATKGEAVAAGAAVAVIATAGIAAEAATIWAGLRMAGAALFSKYLSNPEPFNETGISLLESGLPGPGPSSYLGAATQLERDGLTKAGRALQSHADRLGSAFPKAKGNPAAFNEMAEGIVRNILNAKDTQTRVRSTGRFGKVTEFIASDGRGLRYNENGEFIGFLEPPR